MFGRPKWIHVRACDSFFWENWNGQFPLEENVLLKSEWSNFVD